MLKRNLKAHFFHLIFSFILFFFKKEHNWRCSNERTQRRGKASEKKSFVEGKKRNVHEMKYENDEEAGRDEYDARNEC